MDLINETIELNRLKLISEVYQFNKNCNKCGLCRTRKNMVFGEGNVNSKLMFVGEAPGSVEDIQGRPFVGRCGMLLTEYIEKYLGFERKYFYITNIVKCRPFIGNKDRTPTQLEVDACNHILKNEIDIIKPKVIVPLGSTAMRFFLKDIKQGIISLNGKVFKIDDTVIIPMYHPSYVMRNRYIEEILNEYGVGFTVIKSYL